MHKSIFRRLCGLVAATGVVLSVGLVGGSLGLDRVTASARTDLELIPRATNSLELPLDLFHRAALGSAMTLNAASYVGSSVAVESFVAGLGNGLSISLLAAAPTEIYTILGGTTVTIIDFFGISRPAAILYVSPTQVNHQIPPGTALGPATVIYTNTVTGEMSTSSIVVSSVAPGILSADATGSGIAAAFVLRVRGDGTQNYEPVYEINQGQIVSTPIDLGPSTDKVYLALLGTGIRFRSSLSAVTVAVGGTACEVTYAGAQPQNIGMDQINVLLSRSLAGRGLVNVVTTVDGRQANTVQVSIR